METITIEENLWQTIAQFWETVPSVWNLIRCHLRTIAAEQFDISVEQFHVLRHIRKGFQSVGELADKKQISRSAVSQSVEVLVAKGLVTRRQESDDRRCVLLELTPHASEVMDANFQQNRVWMKKRMASLAPEELGSIQRAMGILRRTFAPEES